jgi:plasmid stabilization system protein ParE
MNRSRDWVTEEAIRSYVTMASLEVGEGIRTSTPRGTVPRRARARHERVREYVLPLANTPHIGRPGRVSSTREGRRRRTRYGIPYRVVAFHPEFQVQA